MANRIPIARAKSIAEQHDLDQVIVVAWDAKAGMTHVVTYGKTLADCEQAAKGGNLVKRALGWPESQCNAKPSRVRKRDRLVREPGGGET